MRYLKQSAGKNILLLLLLYRCLSGEKITSLFFLSEKALTNDRKKILNITRCRKAAIGMFNIIDMI